MAWKRLVDTCKILLFCCILISSRVKADSLEAVEDKELQKLIDHEKFVVVLYSKSVADDKTEEYETELAAIREDLVDSIDASVVKAVDSKLLAPVTPEAEPVIVFYRNRVPVIYDGPANEEIMAETLSQYKETCMKDLTDTSFEHLTQAATGATTGDWLVMFFKDECEDCQALQARLETVACKHRGRINVARVNKGTTGAVTGRRFEISSVPSLVFFRLGRMYRYTLEKYDVDSLSSFVTGWYKNVPGESIPLPKTPFDDLVQLCVDYLRDYPLLFAFLFGLPVFLVLAFWYLMKSEEPKPKKKKKKKENKEH